MPSAEGQSGQLSCNRRLIRSEQLRCDVTTEPHYVPCRRCQRLNLECKIDANFKRVGKRSKNAEMEREIVELRRQLSSQQASPTTPAPFIKTSTSANASPIMPRMHSAMDQYLGSQEAVASLMELRSGSALDGASFIRSPNGSAAPSRRLENVVLVYERVQDLFRRYVILP